MKKMNRVFVTGASGFIGSRLVKALEKKKISIVVLSRSNQLGLETVVCDLKSESIPEGALTGVDTVFHLAGFSHDLRDPLKIKHIYQKINVDATVQLAKRAIRSGVKQFIFVSSVKAGGSAIEGRCMNEEDQSEPEGVYGQTKREAELKLQEIVCKSDMHICIVRSSLVYGPDVKGNLRLMLDGIDRGWFPPLPETGNRRSMIHVDDLVDALILLSMNQRINGEIFYATDGQSYSSREIYEFMCSALKKSIPQWYVPKIFFRIASVLSLSLRFKINKLIGDEYYSSEKLQSLGFKAKRSLKEMNETSF